MRFTDEEKKKILQLEIDRYYEVGRKIIQEKEKRLPNETLTREQIHDRFIQLSSNDNFFNEVVKLAMVFKVEHLDLLFIVLREEHKKAFLNGLLGKPNII